MFLIWNKVLKVQFFFGGGSPHSFHFDCFIKKKKKKKIAPS